MSFLSIIAAGVKLAAGLLSGIGVFVGLGKLFSKKEKEPGSENVGGFYTTGPRGEPILVPNQQIPTRSDSIIAGLRKAQFICGGIGELVQSMTSVVSSFSRLTVIQQQPGANYSGGPREFDPFLGINVNNGPLLPYRGNNNWGPDPTKPYQITPDGSHVIQRSNNNTVDFFPNPAHPSNNPNANNPFGLSLDPFLNNPRYNMM